MTDPREAMREAEPRYRALDESWARWHGRLPRHILTVLRSYELTDEAAAAMSDEELLQLHRFGHRGLRKFRSVVGSG